MISGRNYQLAVSCVSRPGNPDTVTGTGPAASTAAVPAPHPHDRRDPVARIEPEDILELVTRSSGNGPAMTVADAPFDLAEVKLAAPRTRPGTATKMDVIAGLRVSRVPFATVIAPAGGQAQARLPRRAAAAARLAIGAAAERICSQPGITQDG